MKKLSEVIESYLVCNSAKNEKYEIYLSSHFSRLQDNNKSMIYYSIINLYGQKNWNLPIEKKTFLEKSLLHQEDVFNIGDLKIFNDE